MRLCRFAGYRDDGRTVHKQVHRVKSRMEYYWELRSKNAQNIKALMCPLYKYSSGASNITVYGKKSFLSKESDTLRSYRVYISPTM